MGFVYALCDPDTSEIRYIGKTVGRIEDRVAVHLSTAGKTDTYCSRWLATLSVPPEVQCLEECDDPEQAERRWIAWGRSQGLRLTNLTDGGDGSSGFRHSVEARARMSEHAKKRRHTPESREAMRQGNTGKKRSTTTREKIAAYAKNRPQEHNRKISESLLARKHK